MQQYLMYARQHHTDQQLYLYDEPQHKKEINLWRGNMIPHGKPEDLKDKYIDLQDLPVEIPSDDDDEVLALEEKFNRLVQGPQHRQPRRDLSPDKDTCICQ
jgi:hypothetical protein